MILAIEETAVTTRVVRVYAVRSYDRRESRLLPWIRDASVEAAVIERLRIAGSHSRVIVSSKCFCVYTELQFLPGPNIGCGCCRSGDDAANEPPK